MGLTWPSQGMSATVYLLGVPYRVFSKLLKLKSKEKCNKSVTILQLLYLCYHSQDQDIKHLHIQKPPLASSSQSPLEVTSALTSITLN